MATISSTGIGSGLDVNSIVSQLVALEKQPLKTLTLKATNVTNQISAFAQVQSQFASLTDVASRLSLPSSWTARNASSSNTGVATITAASTANATSFSLDVDQLATKQSVSSAARPTDQFVGAGTLSIVLGTWSNNAFTASAVTDATTADTNAALALSNATIANQALADANANLALNPGVQSYIDAKAAAAAIATKAQTASDTAAALAAATNAADVTGLTAGATINVDVSSTDTLTTLAAKINSAGAGVVASVFSDGTQQRLVLNSKETGAQAGFRVQSTALTDFVFDPQNSAGVGMAATSNSPVIGQNAKARINGLAVTSKTNTLTGAVPGVTVTLLTTTTSGYGTFSNPPTNTISAEVRAPITMRVTEDVTPASKNITDFVNAYNTLTANLSDLTKYDASTKTAGLFQGDAAIVGLLNVMRSILGSSSLGATSQRLSDIGVNIQKDGTLVINTTKLSAAANNGTSLQQLFTTNNSNPLTNGFALKFKTFGQGVAATDGFVASKTASLQKVLATNTAEQTKVNGRATAFETRMRAQYSALDSRMASLNALSTYVTQQVAQWNKSTA
jgi:flagellar hook-associated protein 2